MLIFVEFAASNETKEMVTEKATIGTNIPRSCKRSNIAAVK